MMTDDIDLSIPVQEYSFSGGIGELIYGNAQSSNSYNDIGQYLAEEIKIIAQDEGLTLIEPENKIRATVIGAGAFSLSVSGSTCPRRRAGENGPCRYPGQPRSSCRSTCAAGAQHIKALGCSRPPEGAAVTLCRRPASRTSAGRSRWTRASYGSTPTPSGIW